MRVDPGLHRFAVIIGEELGGVICVRYPWLLGPYLELMAILPNHQRRGIGREIISWLETQIAERNIWTVVSSFNHTARHFYQKSGFLEIAILPDLIKPGFAEILLRKQVA